MDVQASGNLHSSGIDLDERCLQIRSFAEVRHRRERRAARWGYDLAAIVKDAQGRDAAGGRVVVQRAASARADAGTARTRRGGQQRIDPESIFWSLRPSGDRAKGRPNTCGGRLRKAKKRISRHSNRDSPTT